MTMCNPISPAARYAIGRLSSKPGTIHSTRKRRPATPRITVDTSAPRHRIAARWMTSRGHDIGWKLIPQMRRTLTPRAATTVARTDRARDQERDRDEQDGAIEKPKPTRPAASLRQKRWEETQDC